MRPDSSLILGIETSCDETAAAVVAGGRVIRSNVISSQVSAHQLFGGVVPEIASRQHVLAITNVTARALAAANAGWSDVGAIAVTRGPGLSGALLVGLNFAKGVALARGLPLLGVNHVEAHLYSVWLTVGNALPPPPPLPMVSLVASGGHTELVIIEEIGSHRRLGHTLDDAAGEAFDKVGRLLGLSYPGGPAIERATARCPDVQAVQLPRAWLSGTYDFSFSGLKTAVLHCVRRESAEGTADGLTEAQIAAIAAGFQESVVDVLSAKLARAVEDFGARSAAIVGGVSANRALRDKAEARLSVPLYVPGPNVSTDNAAMIAGAAYYRPEPLDYDADVAPSLSLASEDRASA